MYRYNIYLYYFVYTSRSKYAVCGSWPGVDFWDQKSGRYLPCIGIGARGIYYTSCSIIRISALNIKAVLIIIYVYTTRYNVERYSALAFDGDAHELAFTHELQEIETSRVFHSARDSRLYNIFIIILLLQCADPCPGPGGGLFSRIRLSDDVMVSGDRIYQSLRRDGSFSERDDIIMWPLVRTD